MTNLEMIRKNRADQRPFTMVEYANGVKTVTVLTDEEAEREWARIEDIEALIQARIDAGLPLP
jgi:hypothetical protein